MKKGFTLVELIVVIVLIPLFLGAVGGYVVNIVKFCQCDFASPYKAEIIRGIGIATGLGIITGWLDLGK